MNKARTNTEEETMASHFQSNFTTGYFDALKRYTSTDVDRKTAKTG